MRRDAVSRNIPDPLRNEEGFVLIASMMVLLILVVLGISATTTSILEVRIAGNDKAAKTSFYEADGGTNVATELLEQNLACQTGFPSGTIGSIQIDPADLAFWEDHENYQYTDPDGINTTTGLPRLPSDGPIFQWNTSDDGGNTGVTLSGRYVHGIGGALQQEAGYEGKGKSAAQGTAALDYKIFSGHAGSNNSGSLLLFQWRHVIGSEDECLYP